jgi:hypothetical protein
MCDYFLQSAFRSIEKTCPSRTLSKGSNFFGNLNFRGAVRNAKIPNPAQSTSFLDASSWAHCDENKRAEAQDCSS